MTRKTEQPIQSAESDEIDNYINDTTKIDVFFDKFKTKFITNKKLESLMSELKTQQFKEETNTFLKMRKINEEKIIQYILTQDKLKQSDKNIEYKLLYTGEDELKQELGKVYKAIDKFISGSNFINEKGLIKGKTLIIFILKNKDGTWLISNISTK